MRIHQWRLIQMFNKKVNPGASKVVRNYLMTYDVININHSLTKRVAYGSYGLTSEGPVSPAPMVGELCDHATKQVIDAIDSDLIGRQTGLSPEQLKPDFWRIVFTSIKQIN